MPWRELLRITPGMFLALQRERHEKAKADMLGFRFLATVVERIVGSDVNYMDDMEDAAPEGDPELFEAWLRSKAEAAKRTTGGDNGASNPDSGKATQGTKGGD